MMIINTENIHTHTEREKMHQIWSKERKRKKIQFVDYHLCHVFTVVVVVFFVTEKNPNEMLMY